MGPSGDLTFFFFPFLLCISDICLDVGEVVGIVIGSFLLLLILVLLIVLLVCLVLRRRCKRLWIRF